MSKLGRPTSAQLRRLVDVGGSGPWEAIELVKQHDMKDDPEVGLWYRAVTGDWDGADASSPEAMALILEGLTPSKYLYAAISGLGAAGAPGVQHLVAILDKESPNERDAFGPSPAKNAFDALCANRAPEAREAAAAHFARMRAGGDDEKAARCRDGLVVSGGELALNALLAELEDERPKRRAAAAQALGALGDPRALPALEAALADPYREVVILEQAPDNITDDFLREAMLRTDEKHPVRAAAAAAVARLRGGPAT
jgi:HEAT repeat protein